MQRIVGLTIAESPATIGKMKALKNQILVRNTAIIAFICFLLGSAAMLGHSIGVNRQADAQLITYALQFLDALRSGTIFDYLTDVHKYPLLPILFLATVYGGIFFMLLGAGRIDSLTDIPSYLFLQGQEIEFGTRLVIFLSAIGTLLLLYRIVKRLYPSIPPYSATLLLLTSFLFSIFSTSVRPHALSTFMTLLAFTAALPLIQKKTRKNLLIAFAAAIAAFCTLQSGFFAFLFPILAFASNKQSIDVRRLLNIRFILIALGSVMIALLVGYPFIFTQIVNGSFSFDLGNDYLSGEWKWTGAGFLILLKTLFGSETFLTLFFLLSLFQIRRRDIQVEEKMLLIYITIFSLVFGLYAGTSTRFFLPILPFLAIFGARFFGKNAKVQIGISLLVSVMYLNVAYLAATPNTFDTARAFIQSETTGAIVTTLPSDSFLGIPPTRESLRNTSSFKERFLASLNSDLPGARTFLPISEILDADVLVTQSNELFGELQDDWSECAHMKSSEQSDSYLWAETDWPVFWVFRTPRLGPDLRIYCRK